MRPITVIGKNSYLARHFLATGAGQDARALGHAAIEDPAALPQSGCVINFAYPWTYMTEPYDPPNDIDRALVERLRESDVHFIMISSRKVYDANSPGPWDETGPLAGQSIYGQNKLVTEDYVRENMEGRHTILRLGNIIEMEPGRHTFLGTALRTLKENGRIELDVLPSTKRDFLPVVNFATALEKVARKCLPGTYNLASGIDTAVGDVAGWIVKGYGEGEIVHSGNLEKDAFGLDPSKLQTIIGPIAGREAIREACMESGRRLRDG